MRCGTERWKGYSFVDVGEHLFVAGAHGGDLAVDAAQVAPVLELGGGQFVLERPVVVVQPAQLVLQFLLQRRLQIGTLLRFRIHRHVT